MHCCDTCAEGRVYLLAYTQILRSSVIQVLPCSEIARILEKPLQDPKMFIFCYTEHVNTDVVSHFTGKNSLKIF